MTRFRAHGFRNLGELDLELGKLNVFIGPNNSGTSNLLDALGALQGFLTGDATRGVDIGDALAELGGEQLPAWGGDQRVALGWDFEGLKYDLAFHVPGDGRRWQSDWRLEAERLEVGTLLADGKPSTSRDVQLTRDAQSTTMSAVVGPRYGLGSSTGWRGADGSQWPELARAFALLWQESRLILHAACPRFPAARDCLAEKRERGQDTLSPRGDNLANVLREFEARPPFLRPVSERVADLVQGLEHLSTEDVPGHVWANLTISGRLVPLDRVSDGTVQLVRLATLLFRSPRDVVCIDEPESSLHPAWQHQVARWFLESPHQSIVCTHSPELLDRWTEAFESGSARLFTIVNGRVERVDPSRFAVARKEGWQFGDLYRVGDSVLGGWPR